ncbi:MAG TPA: ABC transporter permease [Vicinamibacterales bacterium]|nr:ABC transporter permease [Vicinamibacterales bacterium]
MPLGFELRHACRAVFKNPRFSLVAIAALALGIGANAAIFSVVDAVLLQPLPYPEPSQLVRVCRQFQSGIGCSESIPKFMSAARAKSLEAIAAYDGEAPAFNLTGGDRPEQIKGLHASAGYFRVFGAPIAIGRTFTAAEDRPGGSHVAVISHALWESHFGGDPSVTGKTIGLNGDPYVVVGVLSDSFRPDPAADVFIPLQADPNSTNQGHYLAVAGRLAPGVTIAQARAEMKLLGDQFRRANPKWMGDSEQASVFAMRDIVVRDVRPALLILLGAVGLVLLIACANVANLLLARAAGRQREVAVRAAIGAGRGRIVRQLLLESLLLSTAGAVAGVVLGVWGARALLALSPGGLPRVDDFAHASMLGAILDWRIVAFTAGIALTTGVLFGIAPALHLSRTDLSSTLKEGGGRGSSNRRAGRTRDALVVVEMALALMLMIGAALLVRTFIGLRDVSPGFAVQNVLTMRTSLAGSKYSTTAPVETLARTMRQRIDALPGVQAAGVALMMPTQGGADLPFRIEGRALKGSDLYHGDEQWRVITPGYFEAFEIPLLRGRLFSDRDTAGAESVVVINAAMAKKYWPGQDAIGQRLTIGKGLGPEFEDPTRQVVGIVGDVRENGLDSDPPPVMYVPWYQMSDSLTKLGNSLVPASWIVRTAAPSASLATEVQKEFRAVDGQLPVAQVQSMEQIVSKSIAQQNFNMVLLTMFGAIALLLAAIGIYGLMSYSVEQSTHDIGVRLALGAERGTILSLVIARGMKLAVVGLAIGVAGAFAASRLLARLLFGVAPTDPLTYVLAVVGLAVVALLACYLPARRAIAVDPIIALRSE